MSSKLWCCGDDEPKLATAYSIRIYASTTYITGHQFWEMRSGYKFFHDLHTVGRGT